MKIYIITLHRAQNYGSVLQTLALQNKLEEIGTEAYVMDYYPERYTNRGLLKRLKGKSAKLRNPILLLIAKCLIYPSYLKKGWQFNKFLKRIHLVGPAFATNDAGMGKFLDADAYCAGSDQIWNSHWNECVEKALFLDFAPKNKLIFSYAASIGLSEIPVKEVEETKKLLEKFEYISVREDKGVELIKAQLGRKDVVQSLDPTLLMTKEEWEPYVDNQHGGRKYILTYNLHHDPNIDKYAHALGEKYGYEVRNISYNWHDIVRKGHLCWCPTVESFLGLIKHAQFVVADSFHATVFSIIFEKPFITITPEIASSRLSSLLGLLELEDRIVSHFTDISVMEKPINYARVKMLISHERQKSMDYLRKAVSTTSFTHNKE